MTKRTDWKLDALSRLPLFRGCTPGELRLVGRLAEHVELAPGVSLANEGRPQNWFHVIAEGEAQVWAGGSRVGMLHPGDTVGEAALIAATLAPATVVADSPVRTFVFGTREFRGLLAECPAIADAIMGRLSRRVIDLEDARRRPRTRARVAVTAPAYAG